MHRAFCRLRDAALALGLSNHAAANALFLGAINNFGHDENLRLQTMNETLNSLKRAAIEPVATGPAELLVKNAPA
jgi:hypothetical protein